MAENNRTRPFRTPESLAAEKVTRAMLPDFFGSRGFTEVEDLAIRNGQTINVKDPTGQKFAIRVKLCWRRETGKRDSARQRAYSAAQLLAKIGNLDWIQAIRKRVHSEQSHGITHMLFVQNDDGKIVMAALVPVTSIIPIWTAQRDTSARLIASGRIGKRKKNHAMNGNSPTIWLQDDQADEVAQELWTYPGVLNLAAVPESRSVAVLSDLAAIDGPDYEFSDEDQRKVIERQIRERRGQQLFREALRQAHGDKCMATGCTVLAVLEAAHIKPYRGGPDNHPQNGLLLRADIHTLFDLDLLGIEPSSLRIELHPSLASEYQALAGARLMIAESATPSRKALQYRYSQFMIRLSQ